MRHSAIFALGVKLTKPLPESWWIDPSGLLDLYKHVYTLQNLEMSPGFHFSPLEQIHHVSLKGILMRARTRHNLQSGTRIDEWLTSLGPGHGVLARAPIHLKRNGPKTSFPCHLGC